MPMIIGNEVINGIPFINGKPAKDVGEDEYGIFSKWECPECKARLSQKTFICLNACHLSAAAHRRFQVAIMESARSEKSA